MIAKPLPAAIVITPSTSAMGPRWPASRRAVSRIAESVPAVRGVANEVPPTLCWPSSQEAQYGSVCVKSATTSGSVPLTSCLPSEVSSS